ncbi:MAG: hypothetical protein M3Z04_03475 [Chloroflexota bacterium]|nr:hypothetical protein [Chloroflexota bacterium]
MGLDERRLFRQLKDVTVPHYQEELAAIVGSPITYEIDWPAFAEDRDALTHFEERVLTQVQGALRIICVDDLGQEAAQTKIKTIAVRNLIHYDCEELTLSAGTLHLACDWGNGSMWFAEVIAEKLEDLL